MASLDRQGEYRPSQRTFDKNESRLVSVIPVHQDDHSLEEIAMSVSTTENAKSKEASPYEVALTTIRIEHEARTKLIDAQTENDEATRSRLQGIEGQRFHAALDRLVRGQTRADLDFEAKINTSIGITTGTIGLATVVLWCALSDGKGFKELRDGVEKVEAIVEPAKWVWRSFAALVPLICAVTLLMLARSGSLRVRMTALVIAGLIGICLLQSHWASPLAIAAVLVGGQAIDAFSPKAFRSRESKSEK